MKKRLLCTILATMLVPTVASANGVLDFTKLWTYQHTIDAEISAFDSITGNIWVAGVTGVDILDLSGNNVGFINTAAFGEINGIDMYNGTAAFALENSNRTDNGVVQFYNTTSKSLLQQVTVGAMPDMVTFTPDGSKLLVANEGTPDVYGSLATAPGVYPQSYNAPANDPAGTVSIIDTANFGVSTATFSSVPTTGSNIRTNTGMDFEPEYIAVNDAGTKAFVTLQEANAVGVLDIGSATFDQVIGLGLKDFSQAGNGIDVDDKDGVVTFNTQNNLKGLYQPDGIDAFDHNGSTYFVTANEGDYREDDGDLIDRLNSVGVTGDLANLKVSSTDTDVVGEDYVIGGARSFSIWDANGQQVFDSGNQLDVAANDAGIYDDGRSDNKGVEPEDVKVFEVGGSRFVAVGLERTDEGAVAIYDITDPINATFLDLIVTPGDSRAEGLEIFSHNGQTILTIANERSLTTTAYAIAAVPEPQTYAMFLAGLGLLGFARRKHKA